jgi:hypothetical protein
MSIAYGNDLEAVDDAAQRSFKFNADMNMDRTFEQLPILTPMTDNRPLHRNMRRDSNRSSVDDKMALLPPALRLATAHKQHSAIGNINRRQSTAMWIPFDRHPTKSKSSILNDESVRVCEHDALAANVALRNMATDSTHCVDNSIFSTVVNSMPTTATSLNRNVIPNSIAGSIPTLNAQRSTQQTGLRTTTATLDPMPSSAPYVISRSITTPVLPDAMQSVLLKATQHGMPKATKYNALPCVQDHATDGSRLRPATSNTGLHSLHNSMRINDTEATSASFLRYTTSSGLNDQHANSYSTNVANYRSVNEGNDFGVPFQREIDIDTGNTPIDANSHGTHYETNASCRPTYNHLQAADEHINTPILSTEILNRLQALEHHLAHRSQDRHAVDENTIIPKRKLNFVDCEPQSLRLQETEVASTPSRKHVVKLPLFNGETSLNTWLAQFHNAAKFNGWDSGAQLAHLTNSLTGRAADAVFERGDLPPHTIDELITILKLKFGDEGQAEKFRAELRTRKQHPGESLQSLHIDIQRIASKAYPGARNDTADLIARDAFLDALADQEIAYRIRELDICNTDQAYKHAVRLSAIRAQKTEVSKTDACQTVSAKYVTTEESQYNSCARLRDSGTQKSNDNIVQQLLDRLTALESKLLDKDSNTQQSAVQSPYTQTAIRNWRPNNTYANRGCDNRRTWQPRRQPQQWNTPNQQSYFQTNSTSNVQNAQSYSGCFECGSLDHRARNCPNKRLPSQQIPTNVCLNQVQQNPYANNACDVPNPLQPNPSTNGLVFAAKTENNQAGRVPTYLRGKICNRNAYFLIDTGCDTCILPLRFADGLVVRENKINLTAANGTSINIRGLASVLFQLDDQHFQESFMITPDVDEIILGQSFIRNQDVSWHFNSHAMSINGVTHKLHFNNQQVCCRRICAAEDIVIPPLSQLSIPTHAPIRAWSGCTNDCLLNPTEPINGLFVARSLIPSNSVLSSTVVCNTRDTPIHMCLGTRLGMTESVERTDNVVKSDLNVCQITSDRDNAVRDIVDQIISKLPREMTHVQIEQMRTILWKYSNCLSTNEFDLGFTDLVEHTIDTGNSPPIRQTLRRQPLAYQDQIDDHVQRMLQAGVIVPSSSPWCSNVCLVKKKDGKLRFAIDYRHINSISTIPAYPMPRVDSCIDSLGNSAWFSTMDLRSAFWQVKQSEKDAPKTAFITRTGCYQFTRLSFGLSGSPGLFQRLADLIFSGLTWDALLVFLDDIIIFGRTVEEHLHRIEQVFQRLSQANLKITPTKCHFFQKEVNFLGFHISQRGVQSDAGKTAAIANWPRPANVKQLRSFCATINYYRRHVHQFSIIAAPLYELLKKRTRFVWTADHERVFSTLKMRLTTSPILTIFDPTRPTVVDCDASGSGLGAILSQIVDGQERVVAYASRTLNDCEKSTP